MAKTPRYPRAAVLLTSPTETVMRKKKIIIIIIIIIPPRKNYRRFSRQSQGWVDRQRDRDKGWEAI